MIEQVLGDPDMLRRMFVTKAVETENRVPGYDLRHVSFTTNLCCAEHRLMYSSAVSGRPSARWRSLKHVHRYTRFVSWIRHPA